MLYDTTDSGHYIVESGAFQPVSDGLIASFEDGELDDNWGGRKDTVNGDLSTTTQRAVDGTMALRHAADGGFDATRSMPGDGLPIYIGVPSRQRFYAYFEDWSAVDCYWIFCRRNNGNDRLFLRLWGSSDALFFSETVDGSSQSIARDDTPNLPSNQWLEFTITVNGPDGTTFSSLQALEPQVEVWSVNNDFSRNTQLTSFRGDDSQGDPISISSSNALNEGEGGYRWTFSGSAVVDVDYHHEVS